MKIFNKLIYLLSSQERRHLLLLLLMIIIMALLDMIGVASILPFMAVLTNPSYIETNIILNTMFQYSVKFGIENDKQFLFALGVLVFVMLIISLSFKALTTYFQGRFVESREYTIGKRLIEGYLNQPYSWFLGHHSADLVKIILSEVQQIITNGIRPLMELIAKGMVAIGLIILLILFDPKLAFIVGILLGGAYGIIFYFIRGYLSFIGKKRLKNNELRFKAVSEAFGAAKEVKFGGLEKVYIKSFSRAAEIYARTVASAQIIAQLPRFILEAIAFGGVLLIILYIMSEAGSFNDAVPIISLYVFAGYRLMPALQQIYSSFTQLTYVGPSLNKLHNDLNSLQIFDENLDNKKLFLKKDINLKNIHFNYPNTSKKTLENISLKIPVKSTVGLVGSTGSGKTTIIDILLGLLEPQIGTLEIDGEIITQRNLRSWQSLIGYVPQNIYLSDDTVAANIAFGTDPNNINYKIIEKVAKIANLHNFIIQELPNQYKTTIGERGVRLSGGQRQRIGIARALYNNPQILVLDEATSALDNQTEKDVMDAINNLSKNMTIILVAHRLNTVQNCDIIFNFKNGKLMSQGTFKELFGNNKD